MINASFEKLILFIIPLAEKVLAVGEFIASVTMDQSTVPVKAYTGYGIPVSVTLMVPERLRNIHIAAVAIGVIKAQIIPK